MGERLQGLLLLLVGCVGLVLVFLAQRAGWLEIRPPTPAGLEQVPVVSPLSCILPLTAIGSVGLCLLGVNKLLDPDNWQPPKHLG